MPEIYLGILIQLASTKIMQIQQSINAKEKLFSSYTSFNLGKDSEAKETSLHDQRKAHSLGNNNNKTR